MNYFANQKIQVTNKKSIQRTVIVRAQLRQLMMLNGIEATMTNGMKYPVLRGGECKKHIDTDMTRRMNVFQIYCNGQPIWIGERMVENAHELMKCIFASSTMNMYVIFYSHDFINPLYQKTVMRKETVTTVQSVSPVDISIEEVYRTKVKTRRARKELQQIKVSKSPALPSLHSIDSIMNGNVTISLPKLNNLLM